MTAKPSPERRRAVAENTSIEWCDHTFNPWTGCTKVSPGCAHCYAEALSKRAPKTIGGWGKGVPRKRTSVTNWELPRKWNRAAEGAAQRPRVFCASLADWLDDEVPLEWLKDLLVLIQETPHLDWLLLTKRPENFTRRIADVATGWQSSCELAGWWERGVSPENVWVGTTIEDQKRANERVPALLEIPAKVRFLSCEPLLERVTLLEWLYDPTGDFRTNPKTGSTQLKLVAKRNPGIHWVIAGGESGPGARPMSPAWARNLFVECSAARVAYLFKQWGEHDAEGKRVGKKAAGRELDGVTHDAFPAVNSDSTT